MKHSLGVRAAVLLVIAAPAAARADRTLLSTPAKVLASDAGPKVGQRCKLVVTTPDTGCPVTCAATVTCGKQVFDLGQATCDTQAYFDDKDLCPAMYQRKVFTVTGNGSVDAGSGLALVGDGEHSVWLGFAGGRWKGGEVEGKPTARLKQTLKVASSDGVPVTAKTCKVELASYQEPLSYSCETSCVAKVTCGDIRLATRGVCTVPYHYTSSDNHCYGALEALTFEDRDRGLTLSIGGGADDAVEGTVPVFGGLITLAR